MDKKFAAALSSVTLLYVVCVALSAAQTQSPPMGVSSEVMWLLIQWLALIVGGFGAVVIAIVWWLFQRLWNRVERLEHSVDVRLNRLDEVRQDNLTELRQWHTDNQAWLARLDERTDNVLQILRVGGARSVGR
jgi:hypothetical protein